MKRILAGMITVAFATVLAAAPQTQAPQKPTHTEGQKEKQHKESDKAKKEKKKAETPNKPSR